MIAKRRHLALYVPNPAPSAMVVVDDCRELVPAITATSATEKRPTGANVKSPAARHDRSALPTAKIDFAEVVKTIRSKGGAVQREHAPERPAIISLRSTPRRQRARMAAERLAGLRAVAVCGAALSAASSVVTSR